VTVEAAVSVIIPVRNGAGMVERAAASVLGQTTESLELVLVDDASSDETLEVLRRLAGGDPRVRVFSNPVRLGVAATLNRGLRESQSPYVLILHQDCELLGHDWLTRAVLALESGGFAGMLGRPVHDPETMGSREKWFWVIRNHLYVTGESGPEFSDPLFSENKCDLFRRSALEVVHGFDEQTHAGGEDQILAVRLVDSGLRAGQSPDLAFRLTLGTDTSLRRGLAKDRDYGLQMRRVLRRTRFRAIRRTTDGRLDPRLTNRIAGVAWILILLIGGVLWLLTRSPWFLLLVGLPPLLRLVELEARAFSVRRPYHLRSSDMLAVGGVGLLSDLAYAVGTISPYRKGPAEGPRVGPGRSGTGDP
jgi:glycosyltransferase involved in cell wall biosynthesis